MKHLALAIILSAYFSPAPAADLASCEWNPGSNRSTVDPVVAINRLDMPPAMRVELAEKIKRHHFDDVVTIRWASITSDADLYDYHAGITNMNFATGRLCRSITRNGWGADHREGAIVYHVGGRAFGYAAACGNLFELQRVDRAVGPLVFDPPAAGFVVPAVLPSEQPAGALGQSAAIAESFFVAGGGWASPAAFNAPGGFYAVPGVAVPAAPIPEPSAWLLIAVGLVAIFRRTKQ